MTTPEERVQRAEEALSHGHGRYVLGQPVRVHPDQPWPGAGDCIAFACWCCGMDRSAVVDGHRLWIDTTRVLHDATLWRRWFDWCDFTPGCLVVYGDRLGEQGHCGIVVGGTEDRPETIECASSKGGLWRGTRPRGWWARHGALFVVPMEET